MILGDNGTPIIVGNETIYDLMGLTKEHLISLINKQKNLMDQQLMYYESKVLQELKDNVQSNGDIYSETAYDIVKRVRKEIENECSK